MHTQMTVIQDQEKTLIEILRGLSSERVKQVIDFARFLEAQILSEELARGEDIAGIKAENAHWEALLMTDESQALLDKLADEALSEHRAGETKTMAFNDEGRIVPK